MIVRIFWGRIKLGMWDEYERHYNENVVPTAQRMKGFQGRQLMRSVENPDEGVSITLWDSVEDLLNYERSPERQRVALKGERYYAGQYWIGHFESGSWFEGTVSYPA
jgi:heme-degrading monooxygenase HmoA